MIGTKARWMTGALVSAGLILGSVGAAQAQPRYGYGRGWDRGGWERYHRRGDGFGVGVAIGIAALVGAVAVVASSMAKDRKAQNGGGNSGDTGRLYGDDDAPPPRDGTDYGADVQGNMPARDEAPARDDDADFSDIADANGRDDALTDACALAARDEAQRQQPGYAEVRHIDAPRATGADAYNIDGEVESRAGYRATGGTTHRFTCAMKDGRVAQVYLSRDVASR
jgi:hypothetical protein